MGDWAIILFMPRIFDVGDPELTRLLAGYASYKDRVLHSLPSFNPELLQKGKIHRLANLNELYHEVKVVFFDSYGVLNLGKQVVPGMPETVAKLKALGKQIRVLTNNASLTGPSVAQFLNRLGYQFDDSEIVTCGHALRSYFRRHRLEGSNVFYIGTEEGLQYVWEAHGIPVNRPGKLGKKGLAQVAVLASNAGLTQEQLGKLDELIGQGVKVLCLNADIVAPQSERQCSEVMGATVLELEKRHGQVVTMLGKPFFSIFEAAMLPLIGYRDQNILHIGDSLYTDVLGGLCAGIKTVLTPSVLPFFDPHSTDLPGFCQQAGIHPDYYVEKLSDLVFK